MEIVPENLAPVAHGGSGDDPERQVAGLCIWSGSAWSARPVSATRRSLTDRQTDRKASQGRAPRVTV